MIGQNKWSKEDVITMYLQNNPDVIIGEKQVDLANSSANKSAVGFYPQISLNVSGSGNVGSSSLNLRQGGEINASNNLTQLLSSNVGVDYNIYQGGQRKLRLEQLKEQAKLQSLQNQTTIQQGIITVLENYHQVLFLQEQNRILKNQITISQKQYDKAKLNKEYGRISRSDLLNSQTLLKRDSVSLLSSQVELRQAQRNLLYALNQPTDQLDFQLVREFNFTSEDFINEIAFMPLSNTQLEVLAQNKVLLEKELSIAKASRLPTLGVNANYQFSVSDNGDAGFITTQQNSGLGFGVNLSWNIFDGGIVKNQKDQIAIRSEILSLEKSKIEKDLQLNMRSILDQRSSALELMKLEKSNVELAKSNLEEMQNTFEFGQANTLLLREAQLNLLRAELNYLNAQFTAKNLELRLFQLYNLLFDERVEY